MMARLAGWWEEGLGVADDVGDCFADVQQRHPAVSESYAEGNTTVHAHVRIGPALVEAQPQELCIVFMANAFPDEFPLLGQDRARVPGDLQGGRWRYIRWIEGAVLVAVREIGQDGQGVRLRLCPRL